MSNHYRSTGCHIYTWVFGIHVSSSTSRLRPHTRHDTCTVHVHHEIISVTSPWHLLLSSRTQQTVRPIFIFMVHSFSSDRGHITSNLEVEGRHCWGSGNAESLRWSWTLIPRQGLQTVFSSWEFDLHNCGSPSDFRNIFIRVVSKVKQKFM